uniref:Cyclin-dependent kinase inhibitor 1B n=2 Tax=Sphaeramia orbicularis TaxID=375764 RepID=A0A672Z3Y3_9TELE
MSDVRLSNASPTLERVDARQPDSVRPSVRRCLFGTPDREEIRRDLEATIQEDVQRIRETYNFDPVSDTPLPTGDYEWQADSDAPEYFRRAPHGSKRPRRDEDLNCGNSRQDTQERNEGHPDRPPGRDGSRKRPANDSGPCSTERSSKNARTNGDEDDDDDDDEEQSDGAAGLPVELNGKPEVQ